MLNIIIKYYKSGVIDTGISDLSMVYTVRNQHNEKACSRKGQVGNLNHFREETFLNCIISIQWSDICINDGMNGKPCSCNA